MSTVVVLFTSFNNKECSVAHRLYNHCDISVYFAAPAVNAGSKRPGRERRVS